MKRELKYKLVTSLSIDEIEIKRMYFLMQENYDYILFENFKKDLIKKDYVGQQCFFSCCAFFQKYNKQTDVNTEKNKVCTLFN